MLHREFRDRKFRAETTGLAPVGPPPRLGQQKGQAGVVTIPVPFSTQFGQLFYQQRGNAIFQCTGQDIPAITIVPLSTRMIYEIHSPPPSAKPPLSHFFHPSSLLASPDRTNCLPTYSWECDKKNRPEGDGLMQNIMRGKIAHTPLESRT